MKQEVIFILLDGFADWEGAYVAACLNQGVAPGRSTRYVVKYLSLAKDPLVSIGGMTVLPDYDVESLPEDYAGLVLVGGAAWLTEAAGQIAPLVLKAVEQGRMVAGICNASVFLGMHGFLNRVKHTSNTLAYLKQCAGDQYSGDTYYCEKQAVRDGNIVTANGAASLEFCREILFALEADTPELIEGCYQFYKHGMCPE